MGKYYIVLSLNVLIIHITYFIYHDLRVLKIPAWLPKTFFLSFVDINNYKIKLKYLSQCIINMFALDFMTDLYELRTIL